MSFLQNLRENLDAQKIVDYEKGKYQIGFNAGGQSYIFIADSIAGDDIDTTEWFIQFENVNNHLLSVRDDNKEVVNAFVEATKEWVNKTAPQTFWTNGSSLEVYQKIFEGISDKVKGYDIHDETVEEKDSETGFVKEENPVGRIIWTKKEAKKYTPKDDNENIEIEKFEDPGVEDTPAAFKKGTKDPKLDSNDGSYDVKLESFSSFRKQKENLK